MRDIKQVVTSDFYKQNYIAIGDQVFTKQRALQYFSEQKDYILKFNSMSDTPIAKLMPIIYSPLPNSIVLLKDITKKREKIYEKLNISKTNSKIEKLEQTQKLFEYLTKNLNYDMTTKEEIDNVNSYEKVQIYLHAFRQKVNILQEDYNKFLLAKTKEEKLYYKNLVNKNKNLVQELKEKLDEEETKTQSKQVLESIYYALVKNRGICSEFAFAYSYLLNGLNIKNYVVNIKFLEKGNSTYHSLNVIELKENKKTIFYTSDVTLGINLEKNYKEATMINKNNFNKLYPNCEILYIATLNNFEEKTKFVNNYYKENETTQAITNYFITQKDLERS